MATDVSRQVRQPADSTPARPRLKLYRLTVDQFAKMIDARVFNDDARVELLGGVLVNMSDPANPMTINQRHIYAVEVLSDWLRTSVAEVPWIVREEKPFQLGKWSRPEPDLCLARGVRRDYRVKLPLPADIALIVEAADSSYDTDRFEKWRRYAAAGIPEYWIVNLNLRRVEVYRDPAGKGRSAQYRETTYHDDTSEILVVIEGQEIGRIAVRDVLP